MTREQILELLIESGKLKILQNGKFTLHCHLKTSYDSGLKWAKDLTDSLHGLTSFLSENCHIHERLYCLINDLKMKPFDLLGVEKKFSKSLQCYIQKSKAKTILKFLERNIEHFSNGRVLLSKKELIDFLFYEKMLSFKNDKYSDYKVICISSNFLRFSIKNEKFFLDIVYSTYRHTFKFLKNGETFHKRLLFLVNDLERIPICEVCGKNNVLVYHNIIRRNCGIKCSSSNPKTKQKIIETNIRKYGISYPLNRKEIKDKAHTKQAIIKRTLTLIKKGTMRVGGFDLKAQPLFWNLHDRLEGFYLHLKYATKETRDISDYQNKEYCVNVSKVSEAFSRKLDFYVELKNGRKINIEYDSHRKYNSKNFTKALQREQEILTIVPDLIIMSVRSDEYSKNPKEIEDSLFQTILEISESTEFNEIPENFLSFTKFNKSKVGD